MINAASKTVDDFVVEQIANFSHSNHIWEGTMTDLSKEIRAVAGRSNRAYLPGSPCQLRKVIDRNIRRIRVRGVSVNFSRASNKVRTRLVTIISK